jgi:hypothetical protein
MLMNDDYHAARNEYFDFIGALYVDMVKEILNESENKDTARD